MNQNIKFKLKKNKPYSMDLDEFSRWACLVEAVEIISQKAQELKVLNTNQWIKPLAIQKYIDERFPSMRHNMCIEYHHLHHT